MCSDDEGAVVQAHCKRRKAEEDTRERGVKRVCDPSALQLMHGEGGEGRAEVSRQVSPQLRLAAVVPVVGAGAARAAAARDGGSREEGAGSAEINSLA